MGKSLADNQQATRATIVGLPAQRLTAQPAASDQAAPLRAVAVEVPVPEEDGGGTLPRVHVDLAPVPEEDGGGTLPRVHVELASVPEEEDGGGTLPRVHMDFVPRHIDDEPSAPSAVSTLMSIDVAQSRKLTSPMPPSEVPSSKVGTVAGTASLAPPGADAPRLRLVSGKVVPGTRYRIVRWLGEGGMGVVYEAQHVDIERRVALKILRFDLSQQPGMTQVFRDEARAASRLGSKNIVEIYDFGELPDGRLFFAMELLDGHDLSPATPDETMDAARVIGILRQVCKGLHTAHRAGFVHRDVKPENILITRQDGRDDVVKLVDFGICAMLAAGTESGSIAGTPQYMAPEQIMGQPFDARLDVYALGCTAYELLVGHTPFHGGTLQSVLHRQVTQEPVPLRQARPDADVPPALEAVILRCLAKDPNARYVDMADLEAALCEAQVAAGLTTSWDDLPLPELPDLERREQLLRAMPSPMVVALPSQRRFLWPAVATVSSLAAAGLAAFLALRTSGADAREVVLVEELTVQARTAASRADWVIAPSHDPQAPTAYNTIIELEELPGRADPLGDEKAASLRDEFSQTLVRQADKLWDDGATRLARETYFWALAFDPRNEHALSRSGTTHVMVGDFAARAARGNFSEAERIVARAVAAATASDPAQKAERTEALWNTLANNELSEAAEELLVQASEKSILPQRPRRARKPEPEPPQAEPKPEPAMVAAPEPPPSAQPVDPAPATRRAAPRVGLGEATSDPVKAGTLAQSGLDALAGGNRDGAAALFHQAIAQDRRNATALMGLSDVYFDTGEDSKAVLYAERAVSAAPSNGNFRLKLGDAYFKVLRYKDALEQYERAQKLGSSKATSRMAKVQDRLGK